ncbi:MAG: PrsW family glutamic-type intramembrane protease [Acidimicrobiales bacterium]
MTVPAAAHSTTPGPPGWYADPWTSGGWRWWDGARWTANAALSEEQKPRLPAWLSVPVVACSLLAVPLMAWFAYQAPRAVLFGLTPLLIVLPVLLWFDRVEPEPWPSRLHALLWGAVVATTISLIVNTVIGIFGGTILATAVGAPIVEESTKGLGVIWAVRRKEVDSVMDGVIYAGWVALGFAVFEDFSYFASADASGEFWTVFLVRAILTPFAHPLFTSWIGLSIGITVAKQEALGLRVLGGWLVAMACHGLWNGSLVASDLAGSNRILIVAASGFAILFLASLIALGRVRRHERKQFGRIAPTSPTPTACPKRRLHRSPTGEP